MITELRQMIKNMSKFERLFSLIFIVTLISIQIITKSNLFAFTTALFGIGYGICVKYGTRSGLLFGFIQTLFAAITANINGIYGDLTLNSISCVILAIGFIRYNNIGEKNDQHGFRWQSNKQVLVTSIVFTIIYITMFVVLKTFGSYVPFMDAFNSTCSIIAVYLLNMKFKNTWTWWTLTNISSLGLYGYAYFIDGMQVLPIVIMFTMFLINSLHAQYINSK